METDLFPGATIIEGNDIDKYSIEEGKKYLASKQSRVKLIHAAMEELEKLIAGKKFDVVFGAGILFYLKQDQANKLVARMMSHTRTMLTFTGLAHPEIDNAELESSVARKRDGTWIHNIDKMIVDGNTIYFVFTVPA